MIQMRIQNALSGKMNDGMKWNTEMDLWAGITLA
jgi:hypothetical protein